jgi:hypothetical protein
MVMSVYTVCEFPNFTKVNTELLHATSFHLLLTWRSWLWLTVLPPHSYEKPSTWCRPALKDVEFRWSFCKIVIYFRVGFVNMSACLWAAGWYRPTLIDSPLVSASQSFARVRFLTVCISFYAKNTDESKGHNVCQQCQPLTLLSMCPYITPSYWIYGIY